jgi:hypothetical protein
MAGRKKPILMLYYLLHGLGLIIGMIGMASGKVIAFLSAGGILLYFGKSILGIIASIVTFWVVLALLYSSVGKFVVGKGLLLIKFSKRFNRSYIALYGSDFKHPELNDFGLEPEEYYSYNRRFTIDTEVVPFLFIPLSLIFLLNTTTQRGFGVMIIYLLFAICIFIVVKFIIIQINNRLSKKLPQHEKVVAYTKALQIYKSVQEEIKDDADSFVGWED